MLMRNITIVYTPLLSPSAFMCGTNMPYNRSGQCCQSINILKGVMDALGQARPMQSSLLRSMRILVSFFPETRVGVTILSHCIDYKNMSGCGRKYKPYMVSNSNVLTTNCHAPPTPITTAQIAIHHFISLFAL